MRLRHAVMLVPVLLLACSSPPRHLEAIPATDRSAAQEAFWSALAGDGGDAMRTRRRLIEAIALLRTDCELADRLRARAGALATRARERSGRGEPLSGADLDEGNRLLAEGLAWAGRLFQFGAEHDVWIDCDEACRDRHLPLPALDDRRLGALISAAAALELYRAWLDGAAALIEEPALRNALEQGDPGYDRPPQRLRALASDFLDLRHRARVRQALAFAEEGRSALASLATTEPAVAWAGTRLLENPALAVLRQPPARTVGEQFSALRRAIADDAARAGGALVTGTSTVFGNAMGMVAFRRGLLAGRPEIESTVRERLQPGDILLEKTPFRLTDRFIPGHWGHAAIWLGDEAGLRALGLWDDPLVKTHAGALAAGRGVCEALRSGVQLNTLEHFLDIDDLAVLRPRQAGGERERIPLALRQVGKAYDFAFDVETTDRIVCSELVYTVFTGIDWPTSRMIGRFTIAPDAIAVRAAADGPLTVIDLWHEGVRVAGDQTAELARLIAP